MEESNNVAKLANKLVKILGEVGYVQKQGYNQIQKYKFVQESDLVDKVRQSMVEHGVFMVTSVESTIVRELGKTKSGATMWNTEVKTEHAFICSDTGAQITMSGYGQGADTGDKGSGKAITNAVKYVLLKNFLVASGDDPEADRSVDEFAQSTPPEAKPKAKPAKVKKMDGDEKIKNPTRMQIISGAASFGLDEDELNKRCMEQFGVPLAEITEVEAQKKLNALKEAGK